MPEEGAKSSEIDEKMARFEKLKEQRTKELYSVLMFVRDKVGIRMHKGIFNGRSSVEYFRGVNYHLAILQNKDHILKLIPSLKEDLPDISTIDHSKALGTLMIAHKILLPLKKDPRLLTSGGLKDDKTPKYVVPELKHPLVSDTGIYMILEKEDAQSQTMYLVLLVVVVIALMCFRLWPMWLKKGIWYISFYLLVFLVVTAFLRLILWVMLYHFGMEFWLFPNYFIDSNDPRDSFLPVYSFEIRDDAVDYKSIIFRLCSGALIVYMGYQFC